jgi:hypothetical protein
MQSAPRLYQLPPEFNLSMTKQFLDDRRIFPVQERNSGQRHSRCTTGLLQR